jgi:hypothetical protein
MRVTRRARTLVIGVALLSAGAALPSPAGAAVIFNSADTAATTAYFSTPERLLAGDADSVRDTYSVTGGVMTLVSVPGTGAAGPASDAFASSMSPDGSTFVFSTSERLVGADTDSSVDLYKRSGGTTSLVSAPGAGASGAPQTATFKRLSADGGTVVFETSEALVGADTDALNDVYQSSGGTTALVSVPGAGSSGSPQGMTFAAMSADGSRIFFHTTENFIGADSDGLLDAYERSGVTTSLVTAPGVGASGPAASSTVAQVSSDGARAYFHTSESLVTSDTDSEHDLYERSGGTTTLVSEPGVGASGPLAGASFGGASDDGTKIFFESPENLVAADTDGVTDTYQRAAGATTLVSAPGVGASGPANDIEYLDNSGDGSIVIFETAESMVTADADGLDDIYRSSGGSTTLVSAEGLGASGPFEDVDFSRASDDGTRVYFDTDQNMVAADSDGDQDVYEASGGGITLITAPGIGAAGPSFGISLNATAADGSRFIIATPERLTGSDLDADSDLYERAAGVTTLLTGEPGPPFGAPPVTTLTGSAPTFSFSSDEAGSVFECSLDSAPFSACASPQTLTGLGVGSHTFAVRAIDPVGNVDPTPATASFTVDPPATPPKKCKKGRKLKKGKCVKKKRKRK